MPQAQKSIEADKDGKPMIEIVYPMGGAMLTEFLERGKTVKINGATLGFDADAEVRFSNSADTLKMISKDTVSSIDMSGKNGDSFAPG